MSFDFTEEEFQRAMNEEIVTVALPLKDWLYIEATAQLALVKLSATRDRMSGQHLENYRNSAEAVQRLTLRTQEAARKIGDERRDANALQRWFSGD